MQEKEYSLTSLIPVNTTHNYTFLLFIHQHKSYDFDPLNNNSYKEFSLDMGISGTHVRRETVLIKLKEDYYPNTEFGVIFSPGEECVLIPKRISIDLYTTDYGSGSLISQFTVIDVVVEKDEEPISKEEVKVIARSAVPELSTTNEDSAEMLSFSNLWTKSVRSVKRWNFTIEKLIEKVECWRKHMDSGCSGEEAADKVGIRSKTLSDYYNLINYAKEKNFPFKANAKKRVGVLRALRDSHRNAKRKRMKKKKVFLIESVIV